MEIYLVILIIYLFYIKNTIYLPVYDIVNHFDCRNKINEFKNLNLTFFDNNILVNLISDTFVKNPLFFLKRLQQIILNIHITNKIKPFFKKIYNFFYIFELNKYYEKKNKNGILPILIKMGYPKTISNEIINSAKNIVFLVLNIYLVHKCYNDINRYSDFSNLELINYYKNISCMLFLFNHNIHLAKDYIKYFYQVFFCKNNKNKNIQEYLNSLKGIVIDKINLVNLFIEKIAVKLINATNIQSDYIDSDYIKSNNVESNVNNSKEIYSKKIESDKIYVNEININDAYVKNAKVNEIECNKIIVTSDIKMKKKIQKMNINFDDIEKINAYKYQYKDELFPPYKNNQDYHIGLMAQEIENIYPELVVEKNGIKHVNYMGMVPILVENIKDIREKIK